MQEKTMKETLQRMTPIEAGEAPPKLKEIYNGIQKKFGKIPNIFKNMGHSPEVLQGFLALSDTLEKTSLNPQLREQIALTVSQANHCNYCLSAHTAIAKSIGIKEDDILAARKSQSPDKKTKAILSFSKKVVDNRGNIPPQEIELLKSMGVTDKEIVEIIFAINCNMFTNYFNHITDPKIDFPEAKQIP